MSHLHGEYEDKLNKQSRQNRDNSTVMQKIMILLKGPVFWAVNKYY